MLKATESKIEYRFPRAHKKAVAMSYDDGSEHDRRLVSIFNTYGIRGTFHLNSSRLGDEYYIRRDEIGTLYRGHEVSCHTRSHRDLTALADHDVRVEIETDKRDLEDLAGYAVRGLAYPFGTYDDRIVALASELGMAYGRTAESSSALRIPRDFLRLSATCHHNHMGEFADKLLDTNEQPMELMIVWGHSFELDGFMSSDPSKDWNYLEGVCRKLEASAAIWFATMIEIVDYIDALRRVDASRSEASISNPSALPAWLNINGRDVELAPGATIDLTDASRASWAEPAS